MHYAGHMCDMEAICSIANKNGLVIVEDAAQAYGASLNGKKAGSFSLAGALSMNPMKSLGGYGENGVVVTSDEKVYKRLRRLRHAGTTSDPKNKNITNECLEVSLNHKMDTINAALLLIAIKHFPEKIKKREAIARRYDLELSQSILRQGYLKDEVHGRYCYAIKTKEQKKLKNFLEFNQIETKILNQPLACDAPVFEKYNNYSVPKARKMLEMNLVIPSHENLRDNQIDFLISKLNSFYQNQ